MNTIEFREIIKKKMDIEGAYIRCAESLDNKTEAGLVIFDLAKEEMSSQRALETTISLLLWVAMEKSNNDILNSAWEISNLKGLKGKELAKVLYKCMSESGKRSRHVVKRIAEEGGNEWAGEMLLKLCGNESCRERGENINEVGIGLILGGADLSLTDESGNRAPRLLMLRKAQDIYEAEELMLSMLTITGKEGLMPKIDLDKEIGASSFHEAITVLLEKERFDTEAKAGKVIQRKKL